MTATLFAGLAQSATITVDDASESTGGTNCTLRDEVNSANNDNVVGGCVAGDSNNDTIKFDSSTFGSPQTITLNGTEIRITNKVTIDATGQDVTISGNDASRIFKIEGGVSTEVKIKHLKLIKGFALVRGGAVLLTLGTKLTVSNSIFSGNKTKNVDTTVGGALAALGKNTVTIENSRFSENISGHGGAIHSDNDSHIIIKNSKFMKK